MLEWELFIIDLVIEKIGVMVFEWWLFFYGDYKNVSNCWWCVREIDVGWY